MKFILGKKLKMTQTFDEKGNVIPVTLVEAGPCYVTQLKTKDKDKYEAIQIGFEKLKPKKIKKPQKKKPFRYLGEYKGDVSKCKEGDKIDVSVFEEGAQVSISGVSKGKGFAGVVKRWGFKGGPASHGNKHTHRTMGSVGSMFPQRVIKGKKMPGRMGSERVTIKNLKIVKVVPENNLLAIKGAIPGRKGTLLEIRG
jgi:large subunit ribosomal protein L3